MPLSLSAKERIMARVSIEDRGYITDCWISNRSGNGDGYTKIVYNKRTYGTHRLSYEVFVGPIPDHLIPDHLCRQRACCNPSHLELVTRRENVLRGETLPARNAAKTHCPNGHRLEAGNLVAANLRQGSRVCLICSRERSRRYHRRKKEHDVG